VIATLLASQKRRALAFIRTITPRRAAGGPAAVPASAGRVSREDLHRDSALRGLSPQHFARWREAQDHYADPQDWTRNVAAS